MRREEREVKRKTIKERQSDEDSACVIFLPRKDIVGVVLSHQQREILRQIAVKLGQSESEMMHTAFMNYVKSINLLTEKVNGEPPL